MSDSSSVAESTVVVAKSATLRERLVVELTERGFYRAKLPELPTFSGLGITQEAAVGDLFLTWGDMLVVSRAESAPVEDADPLPF